MLPVVNAVWIGERLGPVHAACLASFVRAGHRVVLHIFDPIEDLPDGVEIFDASRLMTKSEIIRYDHKHKFSPALAANIYRLRILRENMGIYVDCDVYCLRPFPDDEYLFGWEGNESINNAVLKMPPDSELLRAIMQDAENPHFVPSWCSTRERRKLRIQQLLGHADTRPKLEWGSLGPRLLTHHIKRLGLEKLAKDIDYFYPSHYAHKRLLNCPDLTVKDHTTHRSLGLHVWSSGIPIKEIQPGSPLDEIVSGYRSQKQLSAETPFA